MRLYLDSADRNACREWLGTGLIYGVTTNPLILEKDQVPCTLDAVCDLVRDILSMGAQEVQVQPWGSAGQKREQIQVLSELSERVVLKLPLTVEGAVLTNEVKAKDPARKVTLTGVYAPHQALVALAAKAEYFAPYYGRMDEAGRDALGDITRMQVIAAHGSTKVLVASIRNITNLTQLAERGLTHFTFAPTIAQALFQEGLTERALADFERAAERNA